MLNFFRRKKPEVPPAAPNDSRATEAAILPPDGNAMAADASAAAGPLATEPVPAEFIAAAMEVEPAPALEPEPVPTAEAADEPAAPGRKGWRDRLRGSAFARSLSGLFSRNPRLDDDLLDEIETALLTADVGVTATTFLVGDLRKRMKAREFTDANALLAALRGDLVAMLRPVAQPLQIDRGTKPFVLLTVGVNGVGKTTTIGKLARRFKDEGRPLMLAAGDTFRAAAIAQLQAWGDRNGVPVIAQGQNADAASVAFDALQAAQARGTEVLIADTAGRLHTQQGLMAELGKIKRVIQKLDVNAPHEVLMVIDGTTGQNALSQLRQFHAAVGVTGLVVTKLDGTAKGGVVFALAREFGIPIRFAGIGERPEDLRVFDADAFVDALLPEALGTSTSN
ncbi:fused signal recognition particle receptor [Lysobacter niabensis]|uniref:Signal recognition particle receptor FtsY n=1 Tax=Agrilutibacter niabensis TaxID=380628 RepID=A0ABU1VPF1_9GAMM|nr:signal recognition particle-docking protein FtsY [Lysobacter niabensis]MDR7099332.1 fused signal recognition particle receptor [Lysobacter niabensis]